MMDDVKWHLFVDDSGIYFWANTKLPLSTVAGSVGLLFSQIVEFTHPDIVIDKAAFIIGADSEPTGTRFKLSLPSPAGSSSSSLNSWFSEGGNEC